MKKEQLISSLKAIIPDVEIEIQVIDREIGYLSIEVVAIGVGLNQKMMHKLVVNALCEATPPILGAEINVRIFEKMNERIESKVSIFIRSIIDSVWRRLNLSTYLGIKVVNDVLKIELSPELYEVAYEKLISVTDELCEISGAKLIVINKFPDIRLYQESSSSVDSDDDDVEINPNWPSTTGNPSGGGRGNNPSK
jgi:hypothetical protein